ncbi:MAG: glycosyltransferase [Actinomycetia bacterium]|nr:glycosyltransferase [Actinomycetes bacterium]
MQTSYEAGHLSDAVGMVDDAKPTPPPLLVASMIVRDEEDLLDEALESIGDLVDRIEILDTGSVDRTVEIALEHGAHVSQAIWRDDFAWARNQVLSGCRDARFVLIVDADERLICPDPEVTRRLLESLPAGLYGISCEVRDMDEGRLVSAQPARRIVTAEGAEWRGAIHELIELPEGHTELELDPAAIALEHVGVSTEISEKKDRRGRNLRITRARLDHDTTAEAHFEYLCNLVDSDEEPVAVDAEFTRILSESPDFHPRHESTLLGYRAALLVQLDRGEEALESAHQATDLVGANHQAAEVEATLLSRLGRLDDLVQRYRDLSTRPSMPAFSEDLRALESWLEVVAGAAVEIGDGETALDAVAHDCFPVALDPWPALVGPSGPTNRRAAASVAGARNDGRFLQACSPNGEVPELEILTPWVEAGGDPEAVMATFPSRPPLSLPPDPELIHAAARLDFESTATVAKWAAPGHIDLELELATLPAAASPELLAEIAMVGLDRIPHTGAVELAHTLDPRRPRVAAVLARDFLGQRQNEQAAQVVEASDTGVAGPVTTALLVDLGILGYLWGRDFDDAIALAADVVSQGATIGVWSDLVTAAGTHLERISALVAVAGAGDTTPLLDAIEDLHPAHQVEYCAGLLAAGVPAPRAVAMGLIGAGAARIDEAGTALAAWAHLLDPEMTAALADGLASVIPDTASTLRASLA